MKPEKTTKVPDQLSSEVSPSTASTDILLDRLSAFVAKIKEIQEKRNPDKKLGLVSGTRKPKENMSPTVQTNNYHYHTTCRIPCRKCPKKDTCLAIQKNISALAENYLKSLEKMVELSASVCYKFRKELETEAVGGDPTPES